MIFQNILLTLCFGYQTHTCRQTWDRSHNKTMSRQKTNCPKQRFCTETCLGETQDQTLDQRLLILIDITRWTFFRVKLVVEFDFEISWSFGPLDHGFLGPWILGTLDLWTLGLLDLGLLDLFPPQPLSHTFSYLLPLWYGLVWFGMGGEDVT